MSALLGSSCLPSAPDAPFSPLELAPPSLIFVPISLAVSECISSRVNSSHDGRVPEGLPTAIRASQKLHRGAPGLSFDRPSPSGTGGGLFGRGGAGPLGEALTGIPPYEVLRWSLVPEHLLHSASSNKEKTKTFRPHPKTHLFGRKPDVGYPGSPGVVCSRGSPPNTSTGGGCFGFRRR